MRRPYLFVLSLLVALTASVQVAGPTVAADTGTGAAVTARPSDSLVDAYGVGVHLNYLNTPYKNTTAVLDALTRLGVRHVRDDLHMDAPWQWKAINTAAARGIKFDLITGRPGDAWTPKQYVDTIAANMPNAVESIEGTNEWDLFSRKSAAEWVPELRARQAALYAAAKANPVTAKVPVLGPALAFLWNYDALGSVASMADEANGHFYAGGQVPSAPLIPGMLGLAKITGAKPEVVTEAGYHNAMKSTASHKATPEDVVGAYMPRLLLESFTRGAKRVYTYELLDEFTDPGLTNAEANFGLLHNDLSPKPAYTAMQTVLGLAADPGQRFTPGSLAYTVTGGGSDLRQLLLQKSNGQFVLFLWRDVSLWNPTTQQRTSVPPSSVQVQLPTSSKIDVYRPTAGRTPITTATTDKVALQLGGEALAVTIDPAPVAATPTTAPTVTPTTAAPTTVPTTAAPTAAPTTAAPTAAPTTAAPTTAAPTTAPTTTAPTSTPTPASDTSSSAPSTPPTIPVILGAPTALTVTGADQRATLSWAAPTSTVPVTGYRVVGSPGGAVVTTSAATRSLVVTGLRNGTRYTFTVRAVAGGVVSPVATFPTVTPATVPGRPALSSVRSRVRGTVSAKWRPPTVRSLPITGYRVKVGSLTVTVGPEHLSTSLRGLRRGSRVRVGIAARNAVGWSSTRWSRVVRTR